MNPWALAFLPSGNYLVTIRKEGLRTVSPNGRISELIAGTPVIENKFALFGMHDVLLDRDFAINRTLYLTYVTTPPGGALPVWLGMWLPNFAFGIMAWWLVSRAQK